MATKRRGPADAVDATAPGAGERAELTRRLKRATVRFDLIQHQRALCEWIAAVDDHLDVIDREIEAIGGLAREQDKARAELLDVGLAHPGFAAAAKAVFAILHLADRQAPLLEELDAATRRRDEARKLLANVVAERDQAREVYDSVARIRFSFRRPSVDVDSQRVLVEQLAAEATGRQTAVEQAETAMAPLSAEAAAIDRELRAFRSEHGESPAVVYARVDAHRRELRALRSTVESLARSIAAQRAALEEKLQNRLERLRGLGLVSTTPEGIEAMVAAIHQSRDMARLETWNVDCATLPAQAENASRMVVALTRRLEVLDTAPAARRE